MNTLVPARLLLLGLLVLFLTAFGAPENVHYEKSFPGRWENPKSNLWPVVTVGAVAFVIGFLFAATISVGGGLPRSHHHRHHARVDWERVGDDAAAVIRKELAAWRGAEQREPADWDEFGRRLEDRLREEIESNRE